MKISELMKSADWKAEKHVPVITALGTLTPGTLQAVAYCNLHGVWESEAPIG